MDTPRPSARSAPTSSPPPTPATPNGSSASTPNQPPYPRPRGSTSHPTRTRNRPQRISEQPASKILTRAGTGKFRCGIGLPISGDLALAEGATATKSARTGQLGTDGQVRESMATQSPDNASLPEPAPRGQNLRQEPSAVVPHAGIRAGGRPQGRSLPRQGTEQSHARHAVGDDVVQSHEHAHPVVGQAG